MNPLPHHAERSSVYIPALDGLRGLAILAVMVHHFVFTGDMARTVAVDRLFYAVGYAGWVGVDLFFVLSGFLITGILLDTKFTPHFFRIFYTRRLLRIFPLYYGFLILIMLVLPRLLVAESLFQAERQDQLWYWAYGVNLFFTWQGWPAYSTIPHFWSLAVEEQFYLVWPLFVFWATPPTLKRVCLVAILLSLGIRMGLALNDNQIAAYVLTLARMDSLAMGALVALCGRDTVDRPKTRYLLWGLGGLSVLMLGGIFVRFRGFMTENPVVYTVGFTCLALFFATIIMAVTTASRESLVNRVLADWRLRLFGTYSYGLYVYHPLILLYLHEHMVTVQDFPTFLGSQLPGQILFTLIATVASLTAAWLSWHLVEVHFIRLKRFVPYQPNPKEFAHQPRPEGTR